MERGDRSMKRSLPLVSAVLFATWLFGHSRTERGVSRHNRIRRLFYLPELATQSLFSAAGIVLKLL